MKNMNLDEKTNRNLSRERRIQYQRATQLELKPEVTYPKRQQSEIIAQKKLENAERQNATLLKENKRLKEAIALYQNPVEESRVVELEITNKAMTERLSDMENRYSQLQSLLDQRTQELKESQTYLKKPDEVPGSTVVKMVEELNTQIFNMAMSIVEFFERNAKVDLEEIFVQGEYIDRCRHTVKSIIGDMLYSANCQVDEAILHRLPIIPEDSAPMQLGLQSILMKWAVKVIGIPGVFSGSNGITNIYKSVRLQEPQSISSQWRIITYHAHPPMLSSDTVVDDIMAFLSVCGLSSQNPGFQRVENGIKRRKTQIDKSVQALRKVVHECVTSSDMELVSVDSEVLYDPITMSEAIESTPVHCHQRVLCTVGLGLKRSLTKKSSESEKTYLHADLLKRPEVALVRVLDNFRKPADLEFDAYLNVDN